MHQQLSYKEQFTPWVPNNSIIDTEINADHIMLAMFYFIDSENFDKYEYMNDVLFSSLFANAICRILISKSQKAYNQRL